MWEQVKRKMVESAREVCGSVRFREKNMWWNNEVKSGVKKKELLGRRCWQLEMKLQNKDVWTLTNKKKRTIKRGTYHTKGGK